MSYLRNVNHIVYLVLGVCPPPNNSLYQLLYSVSIFISQEARKPVAMRLISLLALLAPLSLALPYPPPTFRPASDIPLRLVESWTDHFLFDVPMSEFQANKADQTYAKYLDWRDNGCTSALDKPLGFDFKPACARHDFSYLNYRAQDRYTEHKSELDDHFLKDMNEACARHKGSRGNDCRIMAKMYRYAVGKYGDNYAMMSIMPLPDNVQIEEDVGATIEGVIEA